jgi:hypothetical protein
VGFALADQVCGRVGLGVQRIGGDHAAFDVQAGEDVGQGGYLAGLVRHTDLGGYVPGGLLLDIGIVFKTLRVVLLGKGR